MLGQKALERLDSISPPLCSALPRNSIRDKAKLALNFPGTGEEPPDGKRDLYVLLQQNAFNDEALGQLWAEVNTVPSWVCWDQIARGQDYCAVTDNGSETTQHILQCTQSLESIQPGGAGHASSIRVRLLDAAVRQRIMKLARQRPEYYDVKSGGIPINDLDCIATIGTFCATLIWISLPRQGIFMTQREVTDYVALWRYVAYLTGTPTKHFETPKKAKRVME
ncbi:MAG: hypothetical protein Q9175_008374, partial [Cornicularia normoerica]